MRFLKYILVLFIFSSFVAATKQPDHVIAVSAERMTTDNLGNVYLINKEVISKYDSKGIFQKSFSNKRYGAITSADASNPLRILLYYRDFGRVILLDNMLSEIGDDVKLETLGFSATTCVASSHDNGLWIFDQQNSELIRFNRTMQIENRTGNLSQVIGKDVHASFLIEEGNWVLLSDTSSGIYLFDAFGTYSKLIGLKDLTTFQATEEGIVYFGHSGSIFQPGGLATISLPQDISSIYSEPHDTTALDMRIEKNAIYVLKKDTLKIYDRSGQ